MLGSMASMPLEIVFLLTSNNRPRFIQPFQAGYMHSPEHRLYDTLKYIMSDMESNTRNQRSIATPIWHPPLNTDVPYFVATELGPNVVFCVGGGWRRNVHVNHHEAFLNLRLYTVNAM